MFEESGVEAHLLVLEEGHEVRHSTRLVKADRGESEPKNCAAEDEVDVESGVDYWDNES